MGIRVHKAVGYGIRLQPDDPRFDGRSELRYRPKASLYEWLDLPEVVERLVGLMAAERPRGNAEHAEVQQLRRAVMRLGRDCLHVTASDDDSGCLLFSDPTADDWYRFSDDLDYFEETEAHGQGNRVVMLKSPGLYPYDGMRRIRPAATRVWDGQVGEAAEIRDARGADEHGPRVISGGAYNRLVGRWDAKFAPLASGPLLTHLLEDFRAVLPMGVLAWALWHEGAFPLGLQAVLNDLRPMLCVWWS
jgi:hypothetical protein